MTDGQSPARDGDKWIFKGQMASLEIDYPYIIMEQSDEDDENITINGETTINNDIMFHIEVWAKDPEHRDTLADEIIKVLKNVNSTDHNNESLADKNLIFQRSNKSDHDVYKTDTELVRIKFVEVTFQYIGA
jgi:hypothetical protein